MRARAMGTEEHEPQGLDRLEAGAWWSEWRLARSAMHTANGLAASAAVYFIRTAHKPCPNERCEHGSVMHDDGQYRTCPACGGLQRVTMSLEEVAAEYRAIRARVVELRSCANADFDKDAAEHVSRQPGLASSKFPGSWLAAARSVEEKDNRARAARRAAKVAKWG